jgi:hypothetical protein
MPRTGTHASIALGVWAFAACDGIQPPPTAPSPAQTISSSSPSPAPPSPAPNPGSDAIVGMYTLTLNVGSGCAAIPADAGIRTYAATISATGEAKYLVTLSDSTFLAGPICTGGSGALAGIGCDQFPASRDGDAIRFDLVNNNDEAHGGHIVERLPAGTWIEVIGSATGQLREPTIEASGTSRVWYCGVSSAYPFPCGSFVGCGSNDMQLIFRRR